MIGGRLVPNNHFSRSLKLAHPPIFKLNTEAGAGHTLYTLGFYCALHLHRSCKRKSCTLLDELKSLDDLRVVSQQITSFCILPAYLFVFVAPTNELQRNRRILVFLRFVCLSSALSISQTTVVDFLHSLWFHSSFSFMGLYPASTGSSS